MNRDQYSILLNKAKDLLEIHMQHVTGKWERTKVHADMIKGFVCCKCILVCTHFHEPEKALKNTRIIDTWERLTAIHHEQNQYRLMPIRCQSPTAFAALMSITAWAGSPFHIDHRADHVPYRCYLAYKSPVRVAADKFFAKRGTTGRGLPIDRVDWDGVLKSDTAIGMVVCKPTVTAAAVTQMAAMWDFVNSEEFYQDTGIDPVPWRDLFSRKQRYLFLVGEGAMPIAQEKPITELAQKMGVLIYQKRGLEYHYLPPPANAATAAPAQPVTRSAA
jgi:hypothetical protein